MTRSSSLQCGAIVLIILCGVGLLMNLWVTEHFSDEIYVKVKDDTDWASGKVQFYAAIDNIDHGAAGDQDASVKAIDDECQVPRLEEDRPPLAVTCRRPQPLEGSCLIANKTFHSEPTPTCSHQKKYEICKIESTADGYNVDCTNDICKSAISLGLIDPSIGALKWKQISANVTLLEQAISGVIRTDEKHGNYGFCFLKCVSVNASDAQQSVSATTATQLLLLPKDMSKLACKNETICNEGISINIIWLDSTSHSHFYRSMPKSVAAFQDVRKNEDAAYVFNYNLMQSMAGGTYVNTVAFTSGDVISRDTLLRKRTPIGNLFTYFKNKGHHVTWMDDLCWHWSMENCACGIPKFVGVVGNKKNPDYAKSWKSIQANLLKKGVDQIGASLANCEIMRANKITDPFKDTKNSTAICYNGNYQTHYLLSSMEMLQKQLSAVRRPFFHFLDLNLGHESSGRRIQTLDESLATFIHFLSHQENTFTLMFGDHGNKYGNFVKASKESKVEMAHTILFAMASRNLKDKLGMEIMDALEVNQNRMVNIFDLRNTIVSLIPGTKTDPSQKAKKWDNYMGGLFHPISQNRTCKSMGIKPEAAKCICEEGDIDSSMRNDTRITVMADFALGELNNKIQEQYIAANTHRSTGFGSCQRLVRDWISAVQETTITNKKLNITDMNINVPSGYKSPHSEDTYSVVIHVNQSTNHMELAHYERITTYSVYDKCRDPGVDGDICVCDLGNHTQVNKTWHEISQTASRGHKLSQTASGGHITSGISLTECLFIYERRTPYGLVLEASCDCLYKNYQVIIEIVKQSNIATSKVHPLMVQVESRTMVFLCTFHQVSPLQPWNVVYDVKFRQL